MKHFAFKPDVFHPEILEHFKLIVNESDGSLLQIPLVSQSGSRVATLLARNAGNFDVIHERLLVAPYNYSRLPISKQVLYHLDAVPRKSSNLIIVFGITSVWLLWFFGFPRTVGLLGHTLSGFQIETMSRVLKKRAVVWIVTDKAGTTLENFDRGARLQKKLSSFWETVHVPLAGALADMSSQDVLEAFAHV